MRKVKIYLDIFALRERHFTNTWTAYVGRYEADLSSLQHESRCKLSSATR